MTKIQLDMHTQGKFHHFSRLTLDDGSIKEGYLQPYDDHFVYLTSREGTLAAKVDIRDIKRVEFPEN